MLTPDHLSYLGEALKQLRAAASMTQAEVCGRAGLRAPQLSRWENGREIPTLESLVKYLSAVGADLAILQRTLLAPQDHERRAAEAARGRPAGDGPRREETRPAPERPDPGRRGRMTELEWLRQHERRRRAPPASDRRRDPSQGEGAGAPSGRDPIAELEARIRQLEEKVSGGG